MTERRWLTVKECAEYLRLTERAVYNMLHRNELPFAKLGKRVRIDRNDVDMQLTNSKTVPVNAMTPALRRR